jgi:ubiquinone/menaquinone biosynthesis C-methylase UbiE
VTGPNPRPPSVLRVRPSWVVARTVSASAGDTAISASARRARRSQVFLSALTMSWPETLSWVPATEKMVGTDDGESHEVLGTTRYLLGRSVAGHLEEALLPGHVQRRVGGIDSEPVNVRERDSGRFIAVPVPVLVLWTTARRRRGATSRSRSPAPAQLCRARRRYSTLSLSPSATPGIESGIPAPSPRQPSRDRVPSFTRIYYANVVALGSRERRVLPMSSTKDLARLRRYWDKHSRTYDRQMEFVDRKFFGDTRQWVCRQAEGRVLEVAVGTGLNLPLYHDDVTVTGVDLSPAMLEQARHRAEQLGLTVELHEGDAQRLEFPDASFDTVVSTFSLCAIPDERVAIAEMWRVLRPGGLLVLADHVVSTSAPVRAIQRLLEVVFIPLGGEHFRRRPINDVTAQGFAVQRHERFKLGIVERLAARKPGT